MSTIERRRLAYQAMLGQRPNRPVDRKARAVELILIAGFDSEHPWRNTLAALQGVRPDLTTDEIDEQVTQLLTLGDEVAFWEIEPHRAASFNAAADDYRDALHTFADGPS